MNAGSDILVIGGGVAGLSAAAMLSAHGKVTVLEAEESIGYHSSGRSATMMHYALGNPVVRSLTLASRPFFDQPPEGFSEVPLGHRMPVLVHARREELAELEALHAAIAPFATLEHVDEQGLLDLCPVLRVGEGGSVAGLADRDALRLDTDALLQGYLRTVRRNDGALVSGSRVATIGRAHGSWEVVTERGEHFPATVLINAAGSWADTVAEMAGVTPLGIQPKRRTIITFDAPDRDVRSWPFAKTVGDELYFAPESGRLFASPMDEVPSDPCDAQPDDYEVALAAYRVEERTTLQVKRIHSKWAGLRTFAPDGMPVAGFAGEEEEGFFWLAGQGGSGLQTSPAMARVAESLIAGTPWPVDEVPPEALSPARFLR